MRGLLRGKTMPERYPTGVLTNSLTGRFPPILFRHSPAPSESWGKPEKATRYRSKGHHTKGFDTLEEAMAHINADPIMSWSGVTWTWDGVEIPAMTHWFIPPGDTP